MQNPVTFRELSKQPENGNTNLNGALYKEFPGKSRTHGKCTVAELS